MAHPYSGIPTTQQQKGTSNTIQSNTAELQKHYTERKEPGTKDITERLCLYESLGDRKSVVIESKWLPGARAVDCDDQERAQGKLLVTEIFCTLIKGRGHLGVSIYQNSLYLKCAHIICKFYFKKLYF